MSEVLLLAIAGGGMWIMRASFLTFGAARPLPPSLDRALGQARFAALAGLAAAGLLPYVQGAEISEWAPAFAGAAVAVAVAHRSRSLPWTLAAALVVYWVVALAL